MAEGGGCPRRGKGTKPSHFAGMHTEGGFIAWRFWSFRAEG